MDGNADTILVVEDDGIYNHYLEELLTDKNYSVITAHDGEEGFEKAVSSIPDLIITDLKMGEMGGLELCSRFNANHQVNHIPIIILTALSDEKNLREGLERGAVDYITKPVMAEVLVMKVENILSLREKFIRKNWAHLLGKTFDDADLTEDEALLKEVYGAITDKLGRYDFCVTDLAAELNMSERTLYRKVKDLTGMPVASLIREIRLQRARKALDNGLVKTNSELAAMVGYKSTKQFNKAYENRFGSPPEI